VANPVVFFGELLLRLSTSGKQLLQQSTSLEVHVGGAEANVAVGLSSLGHDTSMISVLPDNALGHLALSAIRGRGVNCQNVQLKPGRMGLYFLAPGASLRPSEIVYDRLGSCFAQAVAEDFSWDVLLAGAQRLHLSGITPALGPNSAKAAIAAAKAAQKLHVPISFDGNYRAMLWERWDSDPRTILSELVSYADILFGNHRDLSLLLGRTFSGDGEDRRREAAQAGFAAFPNLQIVASTARHVETADCHLIATRVDTRDGFAHTKDVAVAGIVDRIGAGDAFAAGVLHVYLNGGGIQEMANAGLALTCLKHSLPGDASLFRQADIDGFHSGELDVRR
jgi:2-dehydro-3-deoxygluconokinase